MTWFDWECGSGIDKWKDVIGPLGLITVMDSGTVVCEYSMVRGICDVSVNTDMHICALTTCAGTWQLVYSGPQPVH